MRVQRLLVNNMCPVTADDARKLYQETMLEKRRTGYEDQRHQRHYPSGDHPHEQ